MKSPIEPPKESNILSTLTDEEKNELLEKVAEDVRLNQQLRPSREPKTDEERINAELA